jgi:NADH:ubiquinone oxidoreductase subunit F (NADH-binding)
LFEAPFGLTLRQIIDDFGGGLRPGARFHFALTGGAAGTIVPASLLDVPIDFGSVARGVSLGAGSFLICDQTVSPVALSRELMRFFAVESCGQCSPCRVGTHAMLVILKRLCSGQGQPGDVAQLEQLCAQVKSLSLCGLGQSAPTAVVGALQHFRGEFEAGIQAQTEPAAIVSSV